ncbi:S41 family peptidase [Roseivirga sp.]|uniref:S41 family peptidase n=1 Tax=Roseivirga sp. TaxID=1964215 RepID=UPI003B52489C
MLKKTIILCLILNAFSSFAQSKSEQIAFVVQQIAQTIEQNYVNEDKAKEIAEALRSNIGEYALMEEEALLAQINIDMHAIHNDRHIQLIEANAGPSLPWKQKFIKSIKLLDGNIGYLKITNFPNPDEQVYSDIASAMAFLKDSDGLIIDIRGNRGGHPSTVAEILGYFIEGSMVYDRFYVPKEDKTYDYETHKKVKGEKQVGKPLSVLIDEKTASVSELFAFAVQNLKLGKVYGQSSMGLVNLAGYYPVASGKYYLLLSKGRQVNPFDENGLENSGVQPDVKTKNTLDEAHMQMVGSIHGQPMKEWLLSGIKQEWNIDNAQNLNSFTGHYGSIAISMVHQDLVYTDASGFSYTLVRIKDQLFELESSREARFRVRFDQSDSSKVLTKLYFDGRKVSYNSEH